MRATSILLLVLSSVSVAAQSLDDFERVLIPAVVRPLVMGQDGAQFESSVVLYAPSGTRYFPRYRANADGAVAAEVGVMQPPLSWPMFTLGPPSRVGRFLYIERARFDAIALDPTLLSRFPWDPVVHQVRLPVVRERDVRSAAYSIVLLNSPTPVAYRHTIRVYDFDGRGDGMVRVRVTSESPVEGTTQELTLSLTSREGSDASYPYYAEAGIPEYCVFVSGHIPCVGGTQRVEVIPLTPALRVWALVSETNNQTQEVKLLY